MQFLAIYLYVMAVGFVAAGVLSSFVQLVSGEPMRFTVEPKSILDSLANVLHSHDGRTSHPHAQRLARADHSTPAEDLVRCIGADRRRVEPILGRASAQPDRQTLAVTRGKKGAGLLRDRLKERPGWVGAGWGMIAGPYCCPQTGDLGGRKTPQWLLEADTAVCGTLSGGTREIQTSGLRSDCRLM